MQLGMVGLGRMGSGMTGRLQQDGHDVKTYDPQVESTAGSLDELASQLDAPRADEISARLVARERGAVHREHDHRPRQHRRHPLPCPALRCPCRHRPPTDR